MPFSCEVTDPLHSAPTILRGGVRAGSQSVVHADSGHGWRVPRGMRTYLPDGSFTVGPLV